MHGYYLSQARREFFNHQWNECGFYVQQHIDCIDLLDSIRHKPNLHTNFVCTPWPNHRELFMITKNYWRVSDWRITYDECTHLVYHNLWKYNDDVRHVASWRRKKSITHRETIDLPFVWCCIENQCCTCIFVSLTHSDGFDAFIIIAFLLFTNITFQGIGN